MDQQINVSINLAVVLHVGRTWRRFGINRGYDNIVTPNIVKNGKNDRGSVMNGVVTRSVGANTRMEQGDNATGLF